MYLSTGNSKLKSTKSTRFLIWNIPAKKTCPFATEHCKKLCYAVKAEKQYPACLPCREKNLAESKSPSFVSDMVSEINSFLYRPSYKAADKIYFRIHESGDFYNQEYFDKWVQIATQLKNVVFLAYTKSVRYVLNTSEKIPENMIIRFSLWDDTKTTDKAIAEDLHLPTYTAENMTEERKMALAERFCECRDCGKCGKCYGREVQHIVCEIH